MVVKTAKNYKNSPELRFSPLVVRKSRCSLTRISITFTYAKRLWQTGRWKRKTFTREETLHLKDIIEYIYYTFPYLAFSAFWSSIFSSSSIFLRAFLPLERSSRLRL